MGKPTASVVLSFLGIGLVAACGGDDTYTPPGGNLVDAPPLIDAGPGDGAPGDGTTNPDGGGGGSDIPVITLTTPDAGSIVAGMVRVEVDVMDDDDIAQVRATVGNQTVTFTRVAVGGTAWQGFLDTVALAGQVSPTVIVRATDKVGDMGQLGFQLILDNVGPISAIDPPNVRIVEPGMPGMPDVCSQDFDPVGGDTPNDGEAVAQLFELRARVVDLGNTGTINSTLFIPSAGVATAKLYVFDDTTKPLVVDSNGDTLCDTINPTIVPATIPMLANEAAVVDLAAIAPAGAAFFGIDQFGVSNGSSCMAGTETESPDPVCLGEPTSTVIIDTPFDNLPQVYGMPPVSEHNCTGFAFDAGATNIADGWACAAIVTTDNVGNQNVSAPLRICIDKDGTGGECPAWGTISAEVDRPNCTGTFANNVVTTTACTPRLYPTFSTANDFELIRP